MAQVETYIHADHDISTNDDYGSGDSVSGSKSPLPSFGFLKNVGASEKQVKADGQLPKRRGPKPDSKPALTRRQELNRQAQRTHRERKEMYIKALEQEVLRIKEQYGIVVKDRDLYAEENRRLRELLIAHNVALPDSFSSPFLGGGVSSSGSISGSYGPPSSHTGNVSPPLMPYGQQGFPAQSLSKAQTLPSSGLNYDQIGIDFVLALEQPCMDHMQMLCVRSNDSEAEISGHALMATCPPEHHLIERPDVQYPHKMPDMQHTDLMKLLDLSNRLPLGEEITPVMAWAVMFRDYRFRYLSGEDFDVIKEVLLPKVRCYGFGAVLEEFEVHDVLETVVASKAEIYISAAEVT